MPKRVLVGYGVDVDAVSGWINTEDGTPANPTDISRGIFGATVGIDRLLTLFAKSHIKATFFVPAHTLESFPSQLAKVRDSGHELGLHGYTHEYVSSLSITQQAAVLDKSIQVLSEFCGGKKPRGWTAPAWMPSREAVRLLEETGIEYDHSFMHHDCQMFRLPDPAGTEVKVTDLKGEAREWMRPMGELKRSEVVEVPANWHLDDWPPFQFRLQGSSHGYVDTQVIERLWKEQFDFFYREYDTFVFPISIHPQVSGKPQVILMHERIIQYINSYEGVEWVTMEQMVDEFKAGRMPGVEVTGGVDL
ncbi:glucose 1-dehydrogenase [Pseudomassariella vexata]|uniref:Glucose 1-dehydrogenase n=1 Tax=Pseudomassariella vexata TaxID=1141098 RepID=A0A1Y2EBS4_9PEZI|nr:glucose 1-dehydrogenase [Pseudomassariella vexata]ORY69001.1 glucose 1-dehydrogenase [Pseudomassariella vexata]